MLQATSKEHHKAWVDSIAAAIGAALGTGPGAGSSGGAAVQGGMSDDEAAAVQELQNAVTTMPGNDVCADCLGPGLLPV